MITTRDESLEILGRVGIGNRVCDASFLRYGDMQVEAMLLSDVVVWR